MELRYKPYKFEFEIMELVKLKSPVEIIKINDTLDSSLEELDWYILEEEARIAEERDIVFKIVDRYFYHGGIPIYKIEVINSVGSGRAAEFYLEYAREQ